jgi:elongation factor Ts
MTNTLMIKPEDVKRLREMTGAGIMDCKRALEESGSDLDAAVLWLREKGLSTAAKKAGRVAREGMITSYIHHGSRLGVLLELNCETDFVARTDDFQELARMIAMHVAALEPAYIGREDVPADVVEEQRYRDTDQKVADLITEKVALLGENIRVARFARMAVGESAPADAEGGEATEGA